MQTAETFTDARVDAAWIASRVGDPSVRIVEIDVSNAAYAAGHIPGAVLWNAYADLRRPDYLPIGADELQTVLGASGVTADTTVVFYGYGAHLGFWLLSSHGHERVRLMDGSRERWLAAGELWSVEAPRPAPSPYALAPHTRELSSKADVLAMIDRPGAAIVDTRSRAEYDGERFWPSGAVENAGRAGHIPGAVHIPIELLRTASGAFRSEGEMRDVMRRRGVTPETRIVTYCTIGNRAAQAWYALKHLLGYRDVSVYYGSWTEWGKSADTPIDS
jgi:thiosulfate/3-mercaptopyruvate sulfurtransferase